MVGGGNLPAFDSVALATATKTTSPQCESRGTILVEWLRSWVLERRPTELSVMMEIFYILSALSSMAATRLHVTVEYLKCD